MDAEALLASNLTLVAFIRYLTDSAEIPEQGYQRTDLDFNQCNRCILVRKDSCRSSKSRNVSLHTNDIIYCRLVNDVSIIASNRRELRDR